MELSNFTEKLNKVDGNIYVIEEEAPLENGVYEAQLKHDNVNEATLAVYTGKKLTGEKVETYTLSTPSLMPWKRIIRVYADVPSVFISYETKGDTVEAEDANLLQDAVVMTQKELNRETERANLEEKKLAGQCSDETMRAKTAEEELADGLRGETERALMAEEEIRNVIETDRLIWEDKYSRSETDNKFSSLETAIDWKETVNSYEDLVGAYPNPEDGWTVNVKDTDYTYRFNGTDWVAISANSIPIATQELNGLLSKEDKRLYDDSSNKKHAHENISVLDQITHAHLMKLDGIAAGAQVNVQPDWNVTDALSDAYIKNKPSGLPASGGNADTVNGHSVDADVPAGAVFTDTVYAEFKGAVPERPGSSGLVPAPKAGQQGRFLRADGTWQIPAEGDFVKKGTTWKELMGV